MSEPSADSPILNKDYIVTMLGRRDVYQVPLALADVDALRVFVTDFYTPRFLLAHFSGRHALLRQRHQPGLSPERTRSSLKITGYDTVARRLGRRNIHHWRRLDGWLSELSRRVARQHPDAGLLSYQNYALRAFPVVNNRPRILFQYHPHPVYFSELFEADYARHPEVRWSFENERDSQPIETHTQENLDEWRHADAVICASSVTRRSLEHVGCAKSIEVVPYGITPGLARSAVGMRKAGEECRFLFVGQGVQRKGLHHLLHAWQRARLGRSRLDVVASRMDPGIAALLPLPGVRLWTRLPESDLAELFEKAHVFVMPSLVEGFGLVYLEALAAGCFCLGTRNTALPDLHLGPDMVDYVEIGEVEMLADRLQRLERQWSQGGFDVPAIAASSSSFTFDRFRHGVRAAIARIEAATA